jgi:hypothetical protein
MRIRHVLSTVGPEASADLCRAQDTTIESIERAIRAADPTLEIDVRAVHFADESPPDREWLTSVPTLERSILDFCESDLNRRLPLLRDVLDAFGDPEEYDLAVYTNVDIALHPLFYDLIRDIYGRGFDAFSINRRTVQARLADTTLADFATAVGTSHPGYDCFVMHPRLTAAEVGALSLGVRGVARALLWNLILRAENYKTISNVHATFHIGDDRAWTDPRFAVFDDHNQRELLDVFTKLVDEFGLSRVRKLPGANTFTPTIEKGKPPRLKPLEQLAQPQMDKAPHRSGSNRLIFSANAGRSGSNYLTELLGAAALMNAGHERQPTMTGPWLRAIDSDGPAPSYEDRRLKAVAIRAELRELGSNVVYADTSHMFVKTFADVIFDDFPHHLLSVVVLRRDPFDVAKSFFALDYLGLGNTAWLDWMSSPTAPAAAFHIPAEEVVDQFDLIFGYLVGVEARTQALRAVTPEVNWVETRLDKITTAEGARWLFGRLKVVPPENLSEVTSRPVNAKSGRKRQFDQKVDRSYVADRWADFHRRFGENPQVAQFTEVNAIDTAT